MKTTKFKTVDEYISALPAEKKKIVKELRKTIKEAAPGAEEVISYNIPAFKLNGGLIYFAAYKEHIGLYPITSGIEKAFKKELDQYRDAKATIRLPLDKPLPLEFVSKIVKVRVKENLEKGR